MTASFSRLAPGLEYLDQGQHASLSRAKIGRFRLTANPDLREVSTGASVAADPVVPRAETSRARQAHRASI